MKAREEKRSEWGREEGYHSGDVKRRGCCQVDSSFSAYCGVPSLAGSKGKQKGLERQMWVKEKVKVRRSRDHKEASCRLDSQHE